MIPRRSVGHVSPYVLIFLVFGFFVATYNLLTMVMHKAGKTGSYEWYDDGITQGKGAKYHVVLTATDAPYSKWQCRIMYYWYKRMRDVPGSDMGGFTRVLHSGKPDNLMDEIPTMVVDPLPEGLDRGYVVLNRPWAFVQWLEKAIIEEEYVLMAEPDHIFVNPLPNLAHGDHPAAFPFFYIKPTENEKIIRKYYPDKKGPLTNIDPIGNSPVIIKKSILEKIAPTWMNVSLHMKHDPETDKQFGWVLEMYHGVLNFFSHLYLYLSIYLSIYLYIYIYSRSSKLFSYFEWYDFVKLRYGYAIASALHGVRHILRKDFMIQPPWDVDVGKKFIIHYTYGCDYTMKGVLTYGKPGEWRFDKRLYIRSPPPRNLPLPPPGVPQSVVRLVKLVNEATANIPGWETY